MKLELLIFKRRCKVRINGKVQETSVGRAILSDIVPKEVPFDKSFNRVMNKKALAELIDTSFRKAVSESDCYSWLIRMMQTLGLNTQLKLVFRFVWMTWLIPDAKEKLLMMLKIK